VYIEELLMGAYAVPEEIRKMKPKGSTVKVVNGSYYVYTNSRHKDEGSGKWKTDPGKLIGKVVPGVGLIPKGVQVESRRITCYEYGEYVLACGCAKDDFLRLKECFTADVALQLFALACIFVFEGYVGLKPSEAIYERSLIAHDYPSLKYSYHRISELLSVVGRNDKMLEFQVKCMEGASTVAVDGHVIPSDSDRSGLSFNGYKAREVKGEQMNLLVALDVDTHLPLATKAFPGYMVDKSDFLEFVEPLGSMEKKLFIMDSGFYSEENINYIVSGKADYIMPLSSNLTAYKEASGPFKGRNAQLLFSTAKKTDLVEYHEVTSSKPKRRVIFFQNMTEREKLLKEYVKKIEEGSKGHTWERLEGLKRTFGVIVLETSLGGEAKDIYGCYKTRWRIETYYDRIKNDIDFTELNLSEYGMIQGVAFVMLLAGRIDQRILAAAKKINKGGKELIRLMGALKLFDNGKSVSVCNTKKEHIEIANTLGLSFDTSSKCLG
jgi:transposase